ncbi:MAG: hypothetical protein HQL82_01895 [Magnetococcales bacterium]|nr:hypothetical protein [Magnetococcales bacterium]
MSSDSQESREPWEESEEHWGFDTVDAGNRLPSAEGGGRLPPSITVSPVVPERRRADSNIPGFERWLRDGLEGHLLDHLTLEEAFPELAPILSRSHSLSATLQELIDRQDSVRRSDFKQALANLLASLAPQPRNIPLFETILQIAVAVKAHEIFHPLVFRIREGFWDRWTTAQGNSLLTEAMLAVSQLAAPRPDALDCLNGLIDSVPFQQKPYPHTLIALESLCRCEPKRFPQHFERLRTMLEIQIRQFQPAAEHLRWTAAALITLVGPARFLEDLISIVGGGTFRGGDDQVFWVLKAVFSPLDDLPPLLLCQEADTEGEWKFYLSGNPTALDFSISSHLGWSRLLELFIQQGWVPQMVLPEGANEQVNDFFRMKPIAA